MALTGLVVVAAYAGSSVSRHLSQPIMGRIAWSETLATPGTTTNVAPPNRDDNGQPFVRLRCNVDAWVAVGKAPNAAASPRIALAANTDFDMFVDPGEKVAWIAA